MSCEMPVIVVDDEHCILVEPEPEVLIVAAGDQGPPGAKGADGAPGPAGGATVRRTAGETLSALRAVYELDGSVFLLAPDDEDHIDLLLGITITAAASGSPVNVQLIGALDDDAWSLIPGLVWLGASGTLTQIPPTSGFDVRIGSAVSTSRVTLNIEEPVWLD